MRRVFVTGANGFLGARLAWALEARQDDVHLFLRPGSERRRLLNPFTGTPIAATVHEGDLADATSLERALEASRPDVIFHVAAYGAGRHQKEAQHLFSSNVLAAHHLLDSPQIRNVDRVVVTGGSSEYGHHSEPLSEMTPLRPVSAYGAAKAASSLLFERAAKKEGLPIVVVRPFSIYGPFEPEQRLIPKTIRAGLYGEKLDDA